jgi:hypothetical protein
MIARWLPTVGLSVVLTGFASANGALFVRLFNSRGDDTPQELGIDFEAAKIELVELDGRVVEDLTPTIDHAEHCTLRLQIPRFGIRTLRFSGIKPPPSR